MRARVILAVEGEGRVSLVLGEVSPPSNRPSRLAQIRKTPRTFMSMDRGWPIPPAAPSTATLRGLAEDAAALAANERCAFLSRLIT